MLGAESVYFRDADVDSIVSRLLNPMDYVAVTGSGTAVNHGLLQSKDATLIGSRVANYGQIEIADGSLMMLGADAVYVRQFDNPILVRLPHQSAGPDSSEDRPEYSVENHGQIRAGLGHVRLAASDPLGWGIRQGTGKITWAKRAGIRIGDFFRQTRPLSRRERVARTGRGVLAHRVSVPSSARSATTFSP